MGYLSILLFIVAAALALDSTSAFFRSGQCPPKNRVYNNKPTCFSDADCQIYGKICCPNQYNTKSCTDRAPYFHNSFNRITRMAQQSPVEARTKWNETEFPVTA